ncbi:hypothetical protein GHT06_006256 [Daphnia sinensis]|uniref:Transposase domain-containing protein n=1 Tax=Daphnia sinensis TaxID=1820382 RepID=A0AAD5PLQ0_9CRUS|nr:hypothetical protein GHT06_006256 [Daphnia sinensis]
MLPVEEQIRFYIKQYGSSARSRKPVHGVVGDIVSGKLYEESRNRGYICDHTITILICADGANPYERSKFGFWPFMGVVNEAPYTVRRSNVIVFALFYGDKKSSMDIFIKPCVDELIRLGTTGIVVDGSTYYIKPLIVSVDAVARPVLRNTTHFNGLYGCDFCLHPGQVDRKGKGHARVYPNPRDGSSSFPLRTSQQHDSDLLESASVHGILGDTPFLRIPGFDFIAAFVPEYMHSVCLGVVRYFLLLWTVSSYNTEPWFIGKRAILDELNKRLTEIKPPSEITRTPQTLENIPYWKASEFRSFVLYYYPILQGVLPEPFFSHFSSLAYSLFGLLQDEIPVNCVRKIEAVLRNFVYEAECLYGSQHITYNMHLLTHLGKSVIDWGCLWSTSAFIPEWINGDLQNLFNGTQNVIDQMAQMYLLRIAIRKEAIDLLASSSIPNEVACLLHRLLCLPKSIISSRFLQHDRTIDGYTVRGKSTKRKLVAEEVVALKNLFRGSNAMAELNRIELELHEDYVFYPKVKSRNGGFFTTSSYAKSPKRINFYSLLKNGDFLRIEKIFVIENNASLVGPPIFLFGYKLGTVRKDIFCPPRIGSILVENIAGQTTRLVGKSKEIVAICIESISKKCVVLIEKYDTIVLTAIPNPYETD